jgi:two-component system chemotaxis response regulator CheB
MVAGFTSGLAEWLDNLCKIKVKEAKDDDVLKQNMVLIAPGNYDIEVTFKQTITLKEIPKNAIYKPSIDRMMKSIAKVYGSSSIGIILTGMGKDGIEGIKAIKISGGATIAQDEDSCVVYGMPKLAIESGYIDKVVSLQKIADEISELLTKEEIIEKRLPLSGEGIFLEET